MAGPEIDVFDYLSNLDEARLGLTISKFFEKNIVKTIEYFSWIEGGSMQSNAANSLA